MPENRIFTFEGVTLELLFNAPHYSTTLASGHVVDLLWNRKINAKAAHWRAMCEGFLLDRSVTLEVVLRTVCRMSRDMGERLAELKTLS